MREGAPSPAVPALTYQTSTRGKKQILRKIRVPEVQGERSISSPCAKKPLLLLWHSLQDGIHPARAPPEAGRSPAGVRRRLEPMRQLPSFLSHFPSFCAVDHEGWAPPVCSFPLKLFLSLRLLLHYSTRPAAFFLFLGTPAGRLTRR